MLQQQQMFFLGFAVSINLVLIIRLTCPTRIWCIRMLVMHDRGWIDKSFEPFMGYEVLNLLTRTEYDAVFKHNRIDVRSFSQKYYIWTSKRIAVGSTRSSSMTSEEDVDVDVDADVDANADDGSTKDEEAIGPLVTWYDVREIITNNDNDDDDDDDPKLAIDLIWDHTIPGISISVRWICWCCGCGVMNLFTIIIISGGTS